MLKISKFVSPTQTSLPSIPDVYVQLFIQHLHLDVPGISNLTHTKQSVFILQSIPSQEIAIPFFSFLGQKALESLWTALSHIHTLLPILQQMLLAVSLKTHLSTLPFFLPKSLPPWSEAA